MKKIYNLTEGSILKKLLLVALPVLLTTITQMAYNFTDMFWIGRVDNIGLMEGEAITAIGTASYMTWLAFGIIIIAKIGTSVKISHAVGEKKEHNIDVYASNGLFSQFSLGIVVSILILIFKEEFLGIFNIDNPVVMEYALRYLPIVGGLVIFPFLMNGFSAINEGLGQTKINLIVLSIGFIMNIILDPILILVLRMGIEGAAIATVFSQAMTVLIFYFVYRRFNPHHNLFKISNFDLKAIKDIFRIGLPVGIQSMLFTVISIYIARMVYVYGSDVVGSQRLGAQIEQLTWMIGGGFQTAITVFVGQNIGAKQYTRIRKGLIYISLILLAYALSIAGLLYFAAAWLMKVFVDDQVIIDHGRNYLQIVSVAQIFMMMEAIGAGMFNGLGKSIFPSLNGIIGNLLRIPFALILSISMNESGIWWALNISCIFKGTVIILAAMMMLSRIERLRLKTSIQTEAIAG